MTLLAKVKLTHIFPSRRKIMIDFIAFGKVQQIFFWSKYIPIYSLMKKMTHVHYCVLIQINTE